MSPSERSLSRATADRRKGADELRRQKAEGMASARAWRAKNGRTDWEAIALAEAGLPVPPRAAIERMPFAGHRTQAEVAADERRRLAA